MHRRWRDHPNDASKPYPMSLGLWIAPLGTGPPGSVILVTGSQAAVVELEPAPAGARQCGLSPWQSRLSGTVLGQLVTDLLNPLRG